ncbi:MAG: PfkB family carbohydrate kinase [Solirubrobacteraceae bacterium]
MAVVGHVEWVDFLPVLRQPRAGGVLAAHHVFAAPAGSAVAAATVLVELGADVDLFCAIGSDEHGREALEQLVDSGIRVHAARRDGTTRRAVAILHRQEHLVVTSGCRHSPSGGDRLAWELLRAADAVYFTAGDELALQCARAAPILVATPRARAAFVAGGPNADALIFSEQDHDEVTWANELRNRAAILVATNGSDGGSWRGNSNGAWSALPIPGEFQNAYGCGDSFAAGFTFALATGSSIADAAEMGATCGATCAARVGIR